MTVLGDAEALGKPWLSPVANLGRNLSQASCQMLCANAAASFISSMPVQPNKLHWSACNTILLVGFSLYNQCARSHKVLLSGTAYMKFRVWLVEGCFPFVPLP